MGLHCHLFIQQFHRTKFNLHVLHCHFRRYQYPRKPFKIRYKNWKQFHRLRGVHWSHSIVLLRRLLQEEDTLCRRTFHYGSTFANERLLHRFIETWFSLSMCLYLYNNLPDDHRFTFLHLCFRSCFFRCSYGIVHFYTVVLYNIVEHDYSSTPQ